jgi:hypothetical protein
MKPIRQFLISEQQIDVRALINEQMMTCKDLEQQRCKIRQSKKINQLTKQLHINLFM